jgi:hypothetical protein
MKIFIKKWKSEILWTKLTSFFSTLSFNPWTILATWLHIGIYEKIQEKWLNNPIWTKFTMDSYGVGRHAWTIVYGKVIACYVPWWRNHNYLWLRAGGISSYTCLYNKNAKIGNLMFLEFWPQIWLRKY